MCNRYEKKLLILVSSLAMAGVLSLTLPPLCAQTNNPAPGAPRHNERHPAIHKAIVALQAARMDLQHADHDFGGHRQAAMEECDKAIAQLREALKFDRH
jgi:hypothetical protein